MYMAYFFIASATLGITFSTLRPITYPPRPSCTMSLAWVFSLAQIRRRPSEPPRDDQRREDQHGQWAPVRRQPMARRRLGFTMSACAAKVVRIICTFCRSFSPASGQNLSISLPPTSVPH